MSQKASELFEEFTNITDLLDSGTSLKDSDRQNILALWGKMVDKKNSGPVSAISTYKVSYIEISVKTPFVVSGKPVRISEHEHLVHLELEKSNPGILSLYESARLLVHQLNDCIEVLQAVLSEMPQNCNIGDMSAGQIAKEMKPKKKAAPVKRQIEDTVETRVPIEEEEPVEYKSSLSKLL